MSNKIKNKKGWIKVSEAFLAILLIAGVIILVAGNSSVKEEYPKERISDSQILILRDIQLNEELRQEIIDTSGEIDWDEGFPTPVKERIEERRSGWLECVAKICDPESECILSDDKIIEFSLEEENIYTQSALITSTIDTFNSRQLKLFCWEG